MKQAGRMICLAVLVALLSTGIVFGGDLEIVESYPKDGQNGMSVENMGVKLTFSDAMAESGNEDCFMLTDADGNKLPTQVYYNKEEPTQVLVLFDKGAAEKQISEINGDKDLSKEDRSEQTARYRIKGNTEYKLEISGALKDAAGNTLGADTEIKFKTLNQKLNTTVYMLMFGGMMVAMFIFSSRAARKQAENASEGSGVPAPFNPYKEARRTGRTVEEVVAEHEKEVARREAKEARRAAKMASYLDEEEEEEEEAADGSYRVKGPRPIAAAGGRYITGRKAEAEARRAEEERLARRRAAAAKKKKK